MVADCKARMRSYWTNTWRDVCYALNFRLGQFVWSRCASAMWPPASWSKNAFSFPICPHCRWLHCILRERAGAEFDRRHHPTDQVRLSTVFLRQLSTDLTDTLCQMKWNYRRNRPVVKVSPFPHPCGKYRQKSWDPKSRIPLYSGICAKTGSWDILGAPVWRIDSRFVCHHACRAWTIAPYIFFRRRVAIRATTRRVYMLIFRTVFPFISMMIQSNGESDLVFNIPRKVWRCTEGDRSLYFTATEGWNCYRHGRTCLIWC